MCENPNGGACAFHQDDPLFATALEVQRLRSEAEKKLRVLAQKADTGSAASASLQDMAAVVQDLTPVLALFGSPQKPSQRQQQEQSSGRQPPNVDDLDCELHTVEDSSLQGVSEVCGYPIPLLSLVFAICCRLDPLVFLPQRFVDSLRAFSRWHNAWEEGVLRLFCDIWDLHCFLRRSSPSPIRVFGVASMHAAEC